MENELDENLNEEIVIDTDEPIFIDDRYNYKTTDFTAGEYTRRLESGRIKIPRFSDEVDSNTKFNLPIGYQRDYAWSNKTRDLFVDSIYKNFPIPPIYLYERDGEYVVVDGGHRLTTIYKYFHDEFKVKFTSHEDIQNKLFSELNEIVRNQLEDVTLRAFIILGNKNKFNEQMFDLFVRFNQGAKPLTKTEIRIGTMLFNNNDPFVKEYHKVYLHLINKNQQKPIIKNHEAPNNAEFLRELSLLLSGIYYLGSKILISNGKFKFLEEMVNPQQISISDNLLLDLDKTYEYIYEEITVFKENKPNTTRIPYLDSLFPYVLLKIKSNGEIILKNKSLLYLSQHSDEFFKIYSDARSAKVWDLLDEFFLQQ